MSTMSSNCCNWTIGVGGHLSKGRFSKIICSGDLIPHFPCRGLVFSSSRSLFSNYNSTSRINWPVFSSTVDSKDINSDDPEDENSEKKSSRGEAGGLDSERLRENLEKFVGADDSTFNGTDLATLIRKKYGRSYDVQLIKKEFMGRNLLALNVMWKYREQRSFPLSEEEYILRLDEVANTLRCWGAVSHIRNSLANSKERPRIGKAVSIFIDMDETGGRANEWIYK